MFIRIILLVVLLLLLSNATYAQTRESRTYDSQGRISTVTYIQGNQALIVAYEYDVRGNLVKTTSAQTTDVKEGEASITVSVQPNPTTQQVTIETPAIDGEAVPFRITDASGRELASMVSVPAQDGKAMVTIDLVRSGLSTGQYLVTATTRQGNRSCSVQLIK